jgi:hypothetical protein
VGQKPQVYGPPAFPPNVESMPQYLSNGYMAPYRAPTSLIPYNNPTAYNSAVFIWDDDEWRADPRKRQLAGEYSPFYNTIGLPRWHATNPRDNTLGHELGHSYWGGLPTQQQDQWKHIHAQRYKRTEDAYNSKDFPAYARNVVPAIQVYSNEPNHSFADLFGEYMHNAAKFRQEHPQLYRWMRSVVGTEYDDNALPTNLSSPEANIQLPNTPQIPTVWNRHKPPKTKPKPSLLDRALGKK